MYWCVYDYVSVYDNVSVCVRGTVRACVRVGVSVCMFAYVSACLCLCGFVGTRV